MTCEPERHAIYLVGSTHGWADDFTIAKQTIEEAHPTLVMAEALQDRQVVTRAQAEEEIGALLDSADPDSPFLRQLIHLCSVKNVPVVGIDLKDYGMSRTLREKVEQPETLTDAERMRLDELVIERESYQRDMVLRHAQRTKGPIVVIVGCWHLREGSPLRSSLGAAVTVLPSDEHGRILFEPSASGVAAYVRIDP